MTNVMNTVNTVNHTVKAKLCFTDCSLGLSDGQVGHLVVVRLVYKVKKAARYSVQVDDEFVVWVEKAFKSLNVIKPARPSNKPAN